MGKLEITDYVDTFEAIRYLYHQGIIELPSTTINFIKDCTLDEIHKYYLTPYIIINYE